MKKLLLILLAFTTVCFGAPTPVANDLDFSNAAILNIANISGRTTAPVTISTQNNQNITMQTAGTGIIQALSPLFQIQTPGTNTAGNFTTTNNSLNINSATASGTANINLIPAVAGGTINMLGDTTWINASGIQVGDIGVNSSQFNITSTNHTDLDLSTDGVGSTNITGANVSMNGLSVASGTNTLLGNAAADINIQAPTGNHNINLLPSGTAVVNTPNGLTAQYLQFTGTVAGPMTGLLSCSTTYCSLSAFSNNTGARLAATGTAGVQLGSTPTGGTVFSNITSTTSALNFGLTGTNSSLNLIPAGTGTIGIQGPTFINNNLTVSNTLVGGTISSIVSNLDNTNAASNAMLTVLTGGTASGNPFLKFTVSSARDWSMGINNAASQDFQIIPAAALGGTAAVDLTTAGNVTFNGSISSTSGTLSTSAATLNISSTATNANINITPKGTGVATVAGNGLNIASTGGVTGELYTIPTGVVLTTTSSTGSISIIPGATGLTNFNAAPIASYLLNVLNMISGPTITTGSTGSVITDTGAAAAVMYNLPACTTVGLNYDFINTVTAQSIQITAAAGDTIQIGDTAVTASGGHINAANHGASVKLICAVSHQWYATVAGTWTAT